MTVTLPIRRALAALVLLTGACVAAQGVEPPATSAGPPARGLIVKLKPTVSSGRESPQAAREHLSAVAGDAGVVAEPPMALGNGHQLVRFGQPLAGAALASAVRRMQLHPDVESIEPDVLLPLAAVPNDPGYPQQWNLQAPAQYAAAINMPPAWDRTTGGPVVVAVLDTGVRRSHPELAGRLLAGYDFVSEVEYANDGNGRDADPSDPGDWVSSADRAASPNVFNSCSVQNSSWHGTFIAGQVGALSNNGAGVAGINWDARVLPVRVSGKCGAFLSDILDALRWSAGLAVAGVPANPTPARVINLSFGGDVACSASYQDAIDEVTARGVLVVSAAGNDGGVLLRPADCRNVLAVGAALVNGQKARYSNFGSTMGLMAPGGNEASGSSDRIVSLSNLGTTSPGDDGYGTKVGTSFSAPQAAGVASLMLSLNPALTPAQLTARLRAGARAHTVVAGAPSCSASATYNGLCNCTTDTCGAGLLDADGATRLALNPAALIATAASASTGATITLDGSASAAATGANITGYRWTQTGGPAATVINADSAVATALLPAGQAGNYVFRLTVTDSVGRSGDDTATVVATAGGGSSGGGDSGGGGGTAAWLGAALAGVAAAWLRRRRAEDPRA